MCGIAGAWSLRRGIEPSVLASMGHALYHRGPDDQGIWSDQFHGIHLVHRRLAIVDLSSAGHQPMLSTCGRYVIVLNGEIYNHLELRERLESKSAIAGWKGHSDTETLLAVISSWGLKEALGAAVGMFAFALWDIQGKKLILARDRLGEKPLYYGWQGDIFCFSSELKALKSLPGFSDEIDREAVSLFMQRGYVPAPHSIYRKLRKLPPGTWLEINSADIQTHSQLNPEPYWSAAEAARYGAEHSLSFASDALAVDALEFHLRQSVRQQMQADVPLGAFLSGGVDSSAVVAMMQLEKRSSGGSPVRTFSIGFADREYNEAAHAQAVAQYLGTEHTELYVSPQDALDVIPHLPSLYDEPFADSSQIPTFLLAKMARQQVTVALSGDAGDELFGGYNRHFLAAGMWRRLSRIPVPLRRLAARLINAISVRGWNQIYRAIAPILPSRYLMRLPGEKIHKAGRLLEAADGNELYNGLITHWGENSVVLSADERGARVTDLTGKDLPSLAEQMMLLDMLSFLPDDILVKVDRAAMGVSLEARIPFLDHRLVEFAWRVPLHYKIRNGQGKWILRQLLYRHIPKELIERPKMGFGVPIDSWLRGPLRDWAEMLLDESRLRSEGYFNPAPIRQKWVEHLSGRRNWQHYLWDVLMFQAWLEAESS